MKLLNRNTLWAELFVEGLLKAGLDTVVISPGSRSTALVLAFSGQPTLTLYTALDERGAAFFALGQAKARQKPVALVCTSGTAVANYLPAVVEASYSHIPLIVISADRPRELHDVGANQSIQQQGIFSAYLRWFAEMPLPEANPPMPLMRSVLQTGARAVYHSQFPKPGPVHINTPFRKPFEPVLVETDFSSEWLRDHSQGLEQFRSKNINFERGSLKAHKEPISQLAADLQSIDRGLIICGPDCPQGSFPELLNQLSETLQYPILADSLSGLRFNSRVKPQNTLSQYESFLQGSADGELANVEVVLKFGGTPTSKHLTNYLLTAAPRMIQINAFADWIDENQQVTDTFWVDPTSFLETLTLDFDTWQRPVSGWRQWWQEIEEKTLKITSNHLNEVWSELALVPEIMKHLPKGISIFSASSLAIRYFDQFAATCQKDIRVYANRGASGIDGTLASAAGVAAVQDKPLVLLIGDLAFYHDMNSLMLISKYNLDLKIVLQNNNGGGIFRRLPVSNYEPAFTQHFLTPHGLNFEHTARQFSIPYSRVSNRNEFISAFQKMFSTKGPKIVEVFNNSEVAEEQRSELQQIVKSMIKITPSAGDRKGENNAL